MNTAAGVSGDVQYEADLFCFTGHDGKIMQPTDETSDQGNTIFECPEDECGARRAVNVHVARIGGESA